jgi:hypothetical protein
MMVVVKQPTIKAGIANGGLNCLKVHSGDFTLRCRIRRDVS